MTVRVALIWMAIALVVLLPLWLTAGALDGLERPCNPSGTLVESTGLTIRDHSSSLCAPGGTGG